MTARSTRPLFARCFPAKICSLASPRNLPADDGGTGAREVPVTRQHRGLESIGDVNLPSPMIE
jgi:hypothetical protein